MLLPSKYTGIFSAIILIVSILFYVPMGAYLSINKDIVVAMKTTKGKLLLVTKSRKINNIYLSISILLVLIMISFGKLILAYFGSVYAQGYSELVIMSIAQLIYSAATSATLFLSCCGEEKYILFVNILTLILLVIFCAILSYLLGFVGVAVGSLSVFMIRIVLFQHRVYKKFDIKALTYL